jgi:hypothetical protein
LCFRVDRGAIEHVYVVEIVLDVEEVELEFHRRPAGTIEAPLAVGVVVIPNFAEGLGAVQLHEHPSVVPAAYTHGWRFVDHSVREARLNGRRLVSRSVERSQAAEARWSKRRYRSVAVLPIPDLGK